MEAQSKGAILPNLVYPGFENYRAVNHGQAGLCFFKSKQRVIISLNHAATIATVAKELCSSDFQWRIKILTESLNVPRRLRGGGHRRFNYKRYLKFIETF
ncbi:MAG: hypothetical protein KHW62_02080 [Clostridiales bacterium]|nr:hypothetical protein [Clostridiales bacterium]